MSRPQTFPPPMIDIHSHILPGVDDGVHTLEDALDMLWWAHQDGVSIQVLTPHIEPGRFDNTKADLNERFEAFADHIKELGMPIELRLAAEVRLCPQITEMVERDGIPWLGHYQGERVFLLELPNNEIPTGSINLIRWLRDRAVRPVIVHPERNRSIQRRPERINPFLEHGCLLQVTASSLSGQFGPDARAVAQKLLKDNKVFALASDCHNLDYRPPNLGLGLKAATKILGKRKAAQLVSTNPRSLLTDADHSQARSAIGLRA